ncbi:MAG TPA: hypothetical protein VFD84_09995 [Candidatus Binatia bacterium]|nr:hypothetical protein [Candidatus Binatia bacterium]
MDAARIKENVQSASEALQGQLGEGIGRVQEKVQENVRRRAEQARGALASANEQFGGFVQESPVLALAGAFALGYVLAKIARAIR